MSVAMPVLLRDHAWLAQVHQHAEGFALVLSREGVDALCSRGKSAFVQALALPESSHAIRLLDEAQAAHGVDVAALLREPLPRNPILVDEHDADDERVIELRVPLDLAHFPGHFAAAPVVPGAVQVAWALSLAAPRLGTSTHCHSMEALKFQQLLRPGAAVTLTLRTDQARGKLYFAYRHGDANYSSGRLVWGAKHE